LKLTVQPAAARPFTKPAALAGLPPRPWLGPIQDVPASKGFWACAVGSSNRLATRVNKPGELESAFGFSSPSSEGGSGFSPSLRGLGGTRLYFGPYLVAAMMVLRSGMTRPPISASAITTQTGANVRFLERWRRGAVAV
jgi:hypothetical protein